MVGGGGGGRFQLRPPPQSWDAVTAAVRSPVYPAPDPGSRTRAAALGRAAVPAAGLGASSAPSPGLPPQRETRSCCLPSKKGSRAGGGHLLGSRARGGE